MLIAFCAIIYFPYTSKIKLHCATKCSFVLLAKARSYLDVLYSLAEWSCFVRRQSWRGMIGLWSLMFKLPQYFQACIEILGRNSLNSLRLHGFETFGRRSPGPVCNTMVCLKFLIGLLQGRLTPHYGWEINPPTSDMVKHNSPYLGRTWRHDLTLWPCVI